MKAMVVYDSGYGNTEKIAQAIGNALGPPENVETLRVGNARPEQFTGLDYLIVGSPTQRFWPTVATKKPAEEHSQKRSARCQGSCI
jgi:flavorubredoxin